MLHVCLMSTYNTCTGKLCNMGNYCSHWYLLTLWKWIPNHCQTKLVDIVRLWITSTRSNPLLRSSISSLNTRIPINARKIPAAKLHELFMSPRHKWFFQHTHQNLWIRCPPLMGALKHDMDFKWLPISCHFILLI